MPRVLIVTKNLESLLTQTATDPPSANSPPMHNRLVLKGQQKHKKKTFYSERELKILTALCFCYYYLNNFVISFCVHKLMQMGKNGPLKTPYFVIKITASFEPIMRN